MKDFIKALGDYPDLLPWQEDVLQKFQHNEDRNRVFMAGRQMGKSYSLKAMQLLMDDLISRPIEELHCSTGTVFGKHYLTVEPVGGNWIEMEQWSTETFGNPSSVWEALNGPNEPGRWYMNDRKFYFLEAADQLMFLMKWR